MRAVKSDQDTADLAASVLDVVARAHRRVADVAGVELVDDRISLGKKHPHFCHAADVVLPLVRIRMPVQLAQSSGLKLISSMPSWLNWKFIYRYGSLRTPSRDAARPLSVQGVAVHCRQLWSSTGC